MSEESSRRLHKSGVVFPEADKEIGYMNYRAEVDGLRAIALLPVIFFHAGFDVFSGGFVGVDIFFVISGYLITSIIMSEMESGTFSLLNFYRRRVRRLFPALALVVIVAFVFSWCILLPRDMKNFSQSLVSTTFFASNILFWFEAGYFDTSSELKPLLHTWSLAVEEQYYILFPAFMILMWGALKKYLTAVVFALLMISLGLSEWSLNHSPESAFYLLYSRLWELLVGVLVAIFLFKNETAGIKKWIRDSLGVFGALLIGYSVFFYSEGTSFPGISALAPTLGAAFIIIFVTKGTMLYKTLASKVMVGIGLISYSAYLWHQPLFSLVHYISFHELIVFFKLGLCAIVFIISYMSWRFVELPFRKEGRIPNIVSVSMLAVAVLFISGIGFLGHATEGYAFRNVGIRALQFEPENKLLQDKSWNPLRQASSSSGYSVENNPSDHIQWFDDEDTRNKLLLVGNSYSKDLFNVLRNSGFVNSNFQMARYGVQIENLRNPDAKFYSAPNFLKADHVLLVTRFDEKDIEALPEVLKRILASDKYVVLVNNIVPFDTFGNKTLSDYVVNTMNKDIDIASQPSLITNEVNSAYYKSYLSNRTDESVMGLRNDIKEIANKFSVSILDRMDYICSASEKRCFGIGENLEKFFYDYGHHTLEGAEYFGQRVDDIGWLRTIHQLSTGPS